MTHAPFVSDSGKHTPLTSWHVQNSAKLATFAGYEMPIQYGSIVKEHQATRTAAGLFDISHMGRLRFEGPRSLLLLDHLLTRRVSDLQVGQVRYSLLCDADGGILDDVLVTLMETPSGRQFCLLVVNASNHAKVVKWIQPHLAEFPDVLFFDATESTAMLAVQGPKAAQVVTRLFPEKSSKISGLGYYRGLVASQMGKPTIISRTGYTGEDGFELITRSEDAVRVWENLLLAGREYEIQPAGLGARDTLRLEAGMPLYGHELDGSIDPVTAGLTFAVNLKSRSFIGAEAIQQKLDNPPTQKRVGLKLEGKRAARENSLVIGDQCATVGRITSGTFSPTLQCPIAMAYLSVPYTQIGTQVTIDVRGSLVSAQVVGLPFYRATAQ